jgi:maltoporin
LNDPFQIQYQAAPAHGLGPPIQALVLDRPRTIATAKYTRYFHPRFLVDGGLKFALYSEFHSIPDGDQPFQSQMRVQHLPSDYGWVIGLQAGAWYRHNNFLNLFLRYAGGLAAYGDLATPQGIDPTRRASSARELVAALSANHEFRRLGLMLGAYVRSFDDPGADPLNVRSYVEWIADARLQLYLTNWLHLAGEASLQQRYQAGYDPYLDRRLAPSVAKLSVLPIISPLGRGTYTRPIVYAIYTYSHLNQDALDALFDPTDIRYGQADVHYIGVGAEWWFQSSYR